MPTQEPARKILITGGAGFVGSTVVSHLLKSTKHHVCCLDKLTYAADLRSLQSFKSSSNFSFVQADICDRQATEAAIRSFQPNAIVHTAAETHVDRSIASADAFIQTNLVGTHNLLEASRNYFDRYGSEREHGFRFLHVSTDEVFGSLGDVGHFTESMPYRPSSPYSATKAGSDHMVLSWYHTYGLPVLLTHSSNNYGPRQFPEKLIPRMILNCLSNLRLPVYGNGTNIRDWLHVEDHAEGLLSVLSAGEPGQSYNIGGSEERTNLEVVSSICQILDELRPRDCGSYSNLISFVADRPGHDFRYSLDTTKLTSNLGWSAKIPFEIGLRATVKWYLENPTWWKNADSA